MNSRPNVRPWHSIVAVLLLCLSWSTAASAQDSDLPLETGPASWRVITESEFFPNVMRGATPAFVFITSRFCSVCPVVEHDLAPHLGRLAEYGRLYQMDLADLSPGFTHRYHIPGVPTMLVFVGRHLSDVVGIDEGNGELVEHVLARNALIDEEPGFLLDFRGRPGPELTIPVGAMFSSINLEGLDLRHRDMRNVVFSGCRLRSAQLNGSDLTGATFSRADLTGADLSGAMLSNTVWINTICPDGSSSSDNGQTCVGH